YGLPFLGDNSFLLDRLEVRSHIPAAHWYERVTEAGGSGPRPHTARLTILIDRAEVARTTSALFAPTGAATHEIPNAAWVDIRPPEAPPSKPPTQRRRQA